MPSGWRRSGPIRSSGSLRLIALLEGAKGLLVLVAGCGLLLLIHRDLHQAAAELLSHLDFNPASRYPRIFLDLVDRLDDRRLWLLASGAACYALLRITEAAGLWFGRSWAQWFGLISGGLYIPLEVYEVLQHAGWARISVLAINIVVVCFLAFSLLSGRRAERICR